MTTKQDAMEAAARAAYIAHHKNGPTDEAFDEPNMGRGGFKTEVVVWNAVAQAAVQAHLAAMEEAGFVMVPVEPTEAMEQAGMEAEIASESYWDYANIWATMLAARPTNGDS